MSKTTLCELVGCASIPADEPLSGSVLLHHSQDNFVEYRLAAKAAGQYFTAQNVPSMGWNNSGQFLVF